jgi:hypothetical protein
MSGTTTKVAFPGTLPTLTVTRQTVVLANNDVSSGVPNSNGQVTAGSIADLAAGGGYVLPASSTTVRGGLRVDGITCTISSGDVLSVVGGGSSPTGITTFMGRSTAAAVITAQDVNGVVSIPIASGTTPAANSASGGAGVAATFAKGDHYHPAIVVTLASLPQTGATTGQAIVWNGTIWAPGTVSGGGGAGTVTNASALTAHGVVIGAGSSAVVITGTGTAGQALISNGASADPTFQDVLVTPTTPRVVTASGAVTVVAGDGLIVINKTTGAATTVNLEASPVAGRVHRIKDGKGDAGTNNITIVPNSGLIDGAANFVIAFAYDSASVEYDGTQWRVV